MKEETKEMLESYIEANVAPILISTEQFKKVEEKYQSKTTLLADCSIQELYGGYVENEFISPKWYQELQSNSSELLVIENLSSISKEEQLKFKELFKYRKVGTLDLPKNCCIIVLSEVIDQDHIAKELYDLLVHVK